MLRLLKNREVKNAGWIIGEQIFQMLVSLIVGVLSARYLGPSNYGALNYTASFISFTTSIAALGMEGVVIKKLIEHPDEEGEYLGGCLIFRMGASLLCMAAVTIVVIILNPSEPLKWTLVFLQSLQLLFYSVYILDSWFQRYLHSKYVSLGKMIACVLVSAYKIFLLVTGKSVVWFAVSNSLTYLIIASVLLFFYRYENGQKLHANCSKGVEVLKDSYHFIISGLMVSIYSQMDKIMIGQMMTDMDVGYYTTATAISGMWIFVPTAIVNSFRPKIMELKQSGNEDFYIRRLEQLYSFIIWLCIAVSIIVCIFARIAVLILYGEQYLGAVSALRIVIWCETFSMIGTARGIWILCENKNKYVKYYLAIGAGANLILNYCWIPVFGIEGAGIATLITQIVTSLIAPLFFKETRVHSKLVIEALVLKWRWKKKT